MPNAIQQILQRKMKSGGMKTGPIKPGVNQHIQAPNPDPRPPTEYNPNGDGKGKGKSNVNQGNVRGGSGVTGQASNPTLDSGAQQTVTSPSTQQTGGNGGFIPGGPTDPRDDQYWADIVRLKQKKDFALQQTNVDEVNKQVAYEEALQNLAFQQPKDILATQENANRGGSFYSSKTGEAVGEIGINYLRQRSDLGRTKQNEDDLRKIARDAIEQGYTADEAAALAAAADRAAQRERDRPPPPTEPIPTGPGGDNGGGDNGGGNGNGGDDDNRRGGGNGGHGGGDRGPSQGKGKGKGKGKGNQGGHGQGNGGNQNQGHGNNQGNNQGQGQHQGQGNNQGNNQHSNQGQGNNNNNNNNNSNNNPQAQVILDRIEKDKKKKKK